MQAWLQPTVWLELDQLSCKKRWDHLYSTCPWPPLTEAESAKWVMCGAEPPWSPSSLPTRSTSQAPENIQGEQKQGSLPWRLGKSQLLPWI